MFSDERESTRSPTTSKTDSYRGGPMSRENDHPYQRRSSMSEENERDDNEYEAAPEDIDEPPRRGPPPPREDQYIAALRYRFPNRPKTDYAYSKPLAPLTPTAPPVSQSSTTTTTTTTAAAAAQSKPITPSASTNTPATRNGAYQSSIRPTSGSDTNATQVSDDKPFLRPALRRVNPDQQNTYARRLTDDTTTPTPTPVPTQTKPIGSGGANVRINDQNIDANRSSTPAYPHQSGMSRTQESVFEKVHSQGGSVSYLGTGTFSQLEHCLRECLEHERRQTGVASHITRHDFPPNASVHEYGYDSNLTSIPREGNPSYNYHLDDYPSRAAAEFSLDDIRYINVALSRNGIPLLPYERSYHQPYPSSVPTLSTTTAMYHQYPTGRYAMGEVVSACQLVEEDPAIINSRNAI
ncbi:unnamed protein product [Rotaria magnacalcarata]|uniref:Uncharacterized protein n=1 Tax=Rotaria magnacalcarata TaxID=392030 RepID=A0A816S7J6_9BILA|nr:unnamed protein product [Rotaria magnacalcarata]CAF3958626.1 unnamed protein product [Rotaria magnacalcarata]